VYDEDRRTYITFKQACREIDESSKDAADPSMAAAAVVTA
jgi:hypothetical protein